ncbi:Pentapeptide repeats containing protein [Faustovirus ST1]|nr:Pentapeptide repeats containing protein [Faustovirus ST1]
MEKSYKCVSGETVVLSGDSVEYVYAREEIEPLLRDMLSLCYFKDPVLINGMVYDNVTIAAWQDSYGGYKDPITRKYFNSIDIMHCLALKFILLCLEDNTDDSYVVMKKQTNADGKVVEVVDKEATAAYFKSATVKFHAPPSNILHACKLAMCAIGNNLATVDDMPAPWIVSKRFVEREITDFGTTHDAVDVVIRTSAYEMNTSALNNPALRSIIAAGAGGVSGLDFSYVRFGEIPVGFKLVNCVLTNCSNFDHLTLIDCQIICDYKCYPLSYYVTNGINNDAPWAATKLIFGYNFAASPTAGNIDIFNDMSKLNIDPAFNSKVINHNSVVANIPHVYRNLRTVKPLSNGLSTPQEQTPSPITNYNIRLKIQQWQEPDLIGGLEEAQMSLAEIKFERCFRILSLLATNSRFKKAAEAYKSWLGRLDVQRHAQWFNKDSKEVIERRVNIPKMVVGNTWLDLSGISYSNWQFKSCLFTKATFAGCSLVDTRFNECVFDTVDFTMACMNNTKFTNCKFNNILPAIGLEHESIHLTNCEGIDNLKTIIPGEYLIITNNNSDNDDE